jgi:integrase
VKGEPKVKGIKNREERARFEMTVTPIRDLQGYLKPEQVERLIDAAPNLRDKLLVRIPWRSGVRVSELVGIRVQDIDFEGRAILIKTQKTRKRNGKAIERRRLVPIDQGTLDMTTEYLAWRKQFPYKGDLLFPITRQRVDQIFWKLGKRVGIKEIGDPAVSKHRKLHPDHLRHLFAIRCVKRGMSVERLQEILGHQSPKSTTPYLQFLAADLHADYDRVWEENETEETAD